MWVKSSVGFTGREMARDVSFSAHGILAPDVFVVENVLLDDRFKDNPLVTGDMAIRFYAGAPLVTPSGDVIGMLGVMDRRERRLSDAQIDGLRILSRQVIGQLELRRYARDLLTRETNLLQVFRSCPVPLAITRWHDRTIVDVNTAFTELFGWSADEIAGQTSMEIGLIAEADALAIRARMGPSPTPVRNQEVRLRTKAGGTRDIVLSTQVMELQHARHALTTLVDVTSRKLATETAMRLSAIVESSQDAIIGKDLNGIVSSWNSGAERIFGYSAAEMIGQPIATIIPDNRRPEEDVVLATIRQGTPVANLETVRRRKDGQLIEVSVTASPIRDSDGVIIGASKITRDVTERRRLERQSLRAQRMESIGTLAGGIAHDLNNVLAPIMLSLEMMREAADPDTLELLDTLQTSARRGADLVRQVLSFARGVEGKHLLMDPSLLIHDLSKVMHDTFPKSIRVQLELPKNIWAVNADPTQLHQVLLNLCVNARDAMPSGGVLTIRAGNIVLDDVYAGMNPDARAGAYVVIEVQDTGTGIAPDDRDRIFEPFFTTKKVGEGTGLGLSTTLGIVKSHGGFINLYSEVGRGSTFKVYIPAITDEASAEERASTQVGLPRGHGETILVVDDERAVREVAQRTLQRFGYRVMLASHGAEAVALYAQHRDRIAAVLTDMAMPIMDGPALIVALRAMDPAVRIIASSGLDTNGAVARATGAGVHHFAPKPYTAETLLRMLDALLHGHESAQ
jgi:PAS domain S-box-containing protein